jgi:hypothetical protein
MRSRLRSDKELLCDIKHDLSHLGKKPRPSPIETILEESVRENYRSNASVSREEPSTDRLQRAKLLEMRKEHQKEINRIKQEHQKEVGILVEGHAKELERV